MGVPVADMSQTRPAPTNDGTKQTTGPELLQSRDSSTENKAAKDDHVEINV